MGKGVNEKIFLKYVGSYFWGFNAKIWSYLKIMQVNFKSQGLLNTSFHNSKNPFMFSLLLDFASFSRGGWKVALISIVTKEVFILHLALALLVVHSS